MPFLPLFDIFDVISTKINQLQTILVDSIDVRPNQQCNSKGGEIAQNIACVQANQNSEQSEHYEYSFQRYKCLLHIHRYNSKLEICRLRRFATIEAWCIRLTSGCLLWPRYIYVRRTASPWIEITYHVLADAHAPFPI